MESLQGKKILIVDDNQDAADILSIMLKMYGAEIQVAYHGLTTVQQCEEWQPDVILLDIGLPLVSGYEICRKLKANNCKARIVAITGYATRKDEQKAYAAGFDAYVPKPAEVEEIVAAITG